MDIDKKARDTLHEKRPGDWLDDPGTARPRWEIYKILRGGMGVVYLVYDSFLNGAFAMKTFQDEVFASNPGVAERFVREARSWVGMDLHENVVAARFVERVNRQPCLFLEFVGGGDLSRWIGTPRLTQDLPQVLRFAIQFCDGMNHVLSQGIKAHRDIKPSNCLVTPENKLKVTDFGLAKVFDEPDEVERENREAGRVGEAQRGFLRRTFGSREEKEAKKSPEQVGSPLSLSRTGEGFGTLAYMAPEQFADAKRTDVRADIYSFGVMVFEMVTGRLPFAGRTRPDFAWWHREARPPALSSRLTALDSLVQRCLAKVPSARYPGFGEVRTELVFIYEAMTGQRVAEPEAQEKLDAAGWTTKGDSLANLGQFAKALADYGRALSLDPQFAQAWCNRGLALVKIGRADEALECYRRAVSLNAKSPDRWLEWGSTLERLGRHDEALSCYDRVLSVDPDNGIAYVRKQSALHRLGRHEEMLAMGLPRWDPRAELTSDRTDDRAMSQCYQAEELNKQGRPAEALACLERALNFNPQYPLAWFAKGQTLNAMGRPEEALACFNRVPDLRPQSSKGWLHKGITLDALRRHEEALASVDRALTLVPLMWEAWCMKGRLLGNLRRFEEGLSCFERGVRLNPLVAAAWRDKGKILEVLGRPKDALACYDQAFNLDSRDTTTCFRRGMILASIGNYKEAVVCFDAALNVSPRDAEVLYSKGIALSTLGRHPEALVCFDRALTFNPRHAKAWCDKGMILRRLGRYAEGFACYEHAIALDPGDALAWANKGLALVLLRRYQEALDCCERGISLSPGAQGAWYGKAVALVSLGRHNEALACFDRALAINPRDVVACLDKGNALAALGRFRDAMMCFEQAQRLGHPQAAQMIQKLRQAMADSGGSKGPAGGR